jgi:hypothetical protein
MAMRGEELDVVLNDDGKPRTVSFPVGPLPAPTALVGREAADGGALAGYPVGCGIAGEQVFCPDRTGAVHRAHRDGSGDRVVASSRSGSRIGAATLDGSHSALSYLASRQTTEGWVSEAWLAVDDEAPVRLSEDGSGATSIVLAPHGPSVVAVTVDARTALTTLHVRPVVFESRAKLGEDVVVFVGGPGERHTTPAIAFPATGPAWAMVPIARDIATFGLAAVRLDEPARVDEPVVWSMYPNGVDPSPVAAAAHASTTWVARVRPSAAEPGSPRELELGTLPADGSFVPRHVLPTTGKITDVSLLPDAHGAVWVAWIDAGGSWLERLACK